MAILLLPWTGPLPVVGDILLARGPRGGGWRLTSVQPRDDGKVMLRGLRFEGAEPAARPGCTVHPYSRTGLVLPATAAVPELSQATQDPRPVSVVSLPQLNARAKALRDKEAAAAAAPPRLSAPREWADPDSPPNQRVPRQVRGRRRCDQIGHLSRNSTTFTRAQIVALEAVKVSYDIAKIGLSSSYELGDRAGRVSVMPLSGPSGAAQRTHSHQREIKRLFDVLGPAGAMMLQFVVLENGGVPQYCTAIRNAAGQPMNRAIAMGRLSYIAQRVLEHWQETGDWHGDAAEPGGVT